MSAIPLRGDLTPEALELEVAEVLAIERHPPLGHVVKAHHQVGEGRLAGTGRADQGVDPPLL